MIKVGFDVDADDWHGHSSETLWASQTDVPDEFVLENAPFFVRGVSYGDRVATQLHGGARMFQRVVARSGHSTYRVIPQLSILATSCTPFPIQSTTWRNRLVSGLYY